jgi:MFS transporter, DHA1 family, multidrug resistance protein
MMATDIFLPSLPEIERYYHITEELTKYAISLNLIGLAVSSLFYGPLADAYGRRPVLLGGMWLFTAATFLCAIPLNFETFLTARFIQGFGGGVAGVIGLACVRDLFPEKKRAKILSITGMAIATSPAIGPIIGGYIASWFNWQAVFLFLGVISVSLTLIILKIMPETLNDEHKHKFSLKNTFKNYSILISSKMFIGYAVIYGLITAIFWIEYSEFPFLYIKEMGVEKDSFGFYSAFGIMIYIIGMLINRKLLNHFRINQIIQFGSILILINLIYFLGLLTIIDPTPMMIRLNMIPLEIGTAFILSNTISRALEAAPKMGGTASALITPLDMSIGALMVVIIAPFYNGSFFPYIFGSLFCIILALGLFLHLRRWQWATNN